MKKCPIVLLLFILSCALSHTLSSMPSAVGPKPPAPPAVKLPVIPKLPTVPAAKPPTLPKPAIPVPASKPVLPAPPVGPKPPGIVIPKPTPPKIALPVRKPTPPGIPSVPKVAPIGVPLTTKPAVPKLPTTKSYEQQAKQIGDGITKINTLKDELKGVLRSLDEEIVAMRKKITEAKAQSFKILHSGTESEAQEQLKKIEAILKEIQALQTKTQTETSKNFTTKIAAIKSQTGMVTQLINTLKAQGAFKQAKSFVPPKVPITKKPAKPTKAVATKKLPLKTRIMNFITNTTAYTISAIKKAWKWIIEPPKKKKAESNVNASKAGPPTAGGLKTPTFGNASNMLKMKIPLLSRALQGLETFLLSFTQQYQQMKNMVKMIQVQLDAYPELKNNLKITKKPSSSTFKDMSLKDMVMHAVSKALDVTAVIFRTTKNIVIKGYNALIHPTVKKISTDVSKKLDEMKGKEKKAEGKEALKQPAKAGLPKMATKPLAKPFAKPLGKPLAKPLVKPILPSAGIPVAKPAAAPMKLPIAQASDDDEDEDEDDEDEDEDE